MNDDRDHLQEVAMSMGYLRRPDASESAIRARYMKGLTSMHFEDALLAFRRETLVVTHGDTFEIGFFQQQKDPFVKVDCRFELPAQQQVRTESSNGKTALWKPIKYLNARSRNAVFFEMTLSESPAWPVSVGFFLVGGKSAGIKNRNSFASDSSDDDDDDGLPARTSFSRTAPRRMSDPQLGIATGFQQRAQSRLRPPSRGYVTSDSDSDY